MTEFPGRAFAELSLRSAAVTPEVKQRGMIDLWRAVREQLNALGMTIAYVVDEPGTEGAAYRVNFQGGSEATAYYTDDLGDALWTGRDMAARGLGETPIGG